MIECANCFPEILADEEGRPRVGLDNGSPTRFDPCEEETRKKYHNPIRKGHVLELKLYIEKSKFWKVTEQRGSSEKMNLM